MGAERGGAAGKSTDGRHCCCKRAACKGDGALLAVQLVRSELNKLNNFLNNLNIYGICTDFSQIVSFFQ